MGHQGSDRAVRLMKADFWKGELMTPPPPHAVHAVERSRELVARFACNIWSTEFILCSLDEMIPHEEGWLLEVAGGGSTLAEYLRRRGFRVVSIDIKRYPYPREITFSTQDMSRLGIRDEAVPIVVTQHPYGDFRPDFLRACLQEWLRVLAPGGYLVATFHAKREWQRGIEAFTQVSLPLTLPYGWLCRKWWQGDPEWRRMATTDELRHFQGAGWNWTSLGLVFQKG